MSAKGHLQTVRLCDRAKATLAGLKDVRFHDLRHTFASRLVQGGVPLYDVMHHMGHKSLDNGAAVFPSGSGRSRPGYPHPEFGWAQNGHREKRRCGLRPERRFKNKEHP
jgi:hypothetical protein